MGLGYADCPGALFTFLCEAVHAMRPNNPIDYQSSKLGVRVAEIAMFVGGFGVLAAIGGVVLLFVSGLSRLGLAAALVGGGLLAAVLAVLVISFAVDERDL